MTTLKENKANCKLQLCEPRIVRWHYCLKSCLIRLAFSCLQTQVSDRHGQLCHELLAHMLYSNCKFVNKVSRTVTVTDTCIR